MNPITMLKSDHRKVSRLFEEHERAGAGGKKGVFAKINAELSVHAELEEQIFYPAVREASSKGAETVKEGYEEHAEVKALLAEISAMEAGDDEYERKVAELRAGVEHHVEEEEREMLPEAERTLGGRLEGVGARMQEMRETLTGGHGAMGDGGRSRPASRGRSKPRSSSARTRSASSRGGPSRSGASRTGASRSGSRTGAKKTGARSSSSRPSSSRSTSSRAGASRGSARKGSRPRGRSRGR